MTWIVVASLVVLCVGLGVVIWRQRAYCTAAWAVSQDLLDNQERATERYGDLQTRIAELEKELEPHRKLDGNEQAVAGLAVLVYQGWHRCNEAASGRFRGHYSKPFVAADGEYELIYRRSGSPDFWSIEPAAQQETEPRMREKAFLNTELREIHAKRHCCPNGRCVPRVRDDEAND